MRAPIRPCDVTSVRAEYLDCCLPGYFQGSDAEEVLAVPLWAGVTYREAYEASKAEFHAGSGTLVELALHALFARLHEGDTDAPAHFARYIEDGEGETVYLYLGLYAESDLED